MSRASLKLHVRLHIIWDLSEEKCILLDHQLNMIRNAVNVRMAGSFTEIARASLHIWCDSSEENIFLNQQFNMIQNVVKVKNVWPCQTFSVRLHNNRGVGSWREDSSKNKFTCSLTVDFGFEGPSRGLGLVVLWRKATCWLPSDKNSPRERFALVRMLIQPAWAPL